ncbi:hypothetical protein OK016_12870 [Vibrio chagasii]|nr:hypothetical protein [Vibrio chagasii]
MIWMTNGGIQPNIVQEIGTSFVCSMRNVAHVLLVEQKLPPERSVTVFALFTVTAQEACGNIVSMSL